MNKDVENQILLKIIFKNLTLNSSVMMIGLKKYNQNLSKVSRRVGGRGVRGVRTIPL